MATDALVRGRRRKEGTFGPTTRGPEAPQSALWRPLNASTTCSRSECLALLRSTKVGRVGVSLAALPAILPVNFVLFDDAVAFWTVPGTKLDAALSGAVVAFQADAYAPDGSAGQHLQFVGQAAEMTDPVKLDALRYSGLESWAHRRGTPAEPCWSSWLGSTGGGSAHGAGWSHEADAVSTVRLRPWVCGTASISSSRRPPAAVAAAFRDAPADLGVD